MADAAPVSKKARTSSAIGPPAGKDAHGFDRPTIELCGHMSKEPRLAGKVCVISGASRGFGQAIAIRFVEEGAKVVLLSRSPCDETLSFISEIDGLEDVEACTLWCKCDIADEDAVKAAYEATEKKFGDTVHVLVNNAALFLFHSVETASAADWDRTCAVNVKGHALVTKYALPMMKKADGASIVFQGSISSFLSQPDCSTYSTIKGAVVQMARSCSYDFAKYHIRVNSICAGTIETPISQSERDAHEWTYDEWEAKKIGDVILGRVGHPREIANATLFFACNESSYCTGTHLMVDGGVSTCTTMNFA